MIQQETSLPVNTKCTLLAISRSSLYYKSVKDEPDAAELALCRCIDALHLQYPWMGSRSIRDQLQRKHALPVNRKRVQRLMRKMGMHAVVPGPKTSQPGKGHTLYPYLLRNLTIDRPNQVWATDITYIPMRKGFVYLVAIMDWYSRRVLSWRVSNSLDSVFCADALKEAIAHYGTPQIFNTDQGAQFTSEDFTQVLHKAEIKMSMDGKGRWMDKVFVERMWRSVKYEEVYLHAYESIPEARAGIKRWIKFYNFERTHQSLDRMTPDQVYSNQPEEALAA